MCFGSYIYIYIYIVKYLYVYALVTKCPVTKSLNPLSIINLGMPYEVDGSDTISNAEELPDLHAHDIDEHQTHHASSSDSLQGKLSGLKLSEQDIEFIIEQGNKFIGKPQFLAKKRKIHLDTAKSALEILTSTTVKPNIEITNAQIKSISSFLKEYPESENLEDIVLMCEIEEEIVAEYLEKKTLTNKQKTNIQEKYNTGCSIDDIANILNIPKAKVSQYVLDTFLSFTGEEGEAFENDTQNSSGF